MAYCENYFYGIGMKIFIVSECKQFQSKKCFDENLSERNVITMISSSSKFRTKCVA